MKTKSFTLIELLVVIVIIGILAGVIVVSTSSAIDKANFAKAQSFSSTVQNELLLDINSEYSFDEMLGTVDQPLANNTLVKDNYSKNNLYTEGGPYLKDEEDCVRGKCLDFINDSATNLNRIYVDNNFDFSPVFTISYWINKRGSCRYDAGVYSGTNPSGGILEVRNNVTNGYVFYHTIISGNQVSVYLMFSDNTSTGQVIFDIPKNILNSWHLMTFSYDESNNFKAYFDGESFYSNVLGAGKTLEIPSDMRASIGKITTYWTKGKIDEFQIYKNVLTSSQIKQNYIAGLDSLLANDNISKEEYDQRINVLAYEKQ